MVVVAEVCVDDWDPCAVDEVAVERVVGTLDVATWVCVETSPVVVDVDPGPPDMNQAIIKRPNNVTMVTDDARSPLFIGVALFVSDFKH